MKLPIVEEAKKEMTEMELNNEINMAESHIDRLREILEEGSE